MIFKKWLDSEGMSLAAFKELLESIYGRAPTIATLSKITTGKNNPGLEIAIMINEVSKGDVSFNDMLVNTAWMEPKTPEAVTVTESFGGLLDGIE